MANIRDEIVENRRRRVAAEGHALGASVPDLRVPPVVPFLRDPPVICEVKRRSPSRGVIDPNLDPVSLAGVYASHGARSVSVLTEEDHFNGSLDDLTAIKRAHPELALLRKDFLFDPKDITISHRAGADAVLLIASILSRSQLAELSGAASELGLQSLVELHDPADVKKVSPLSPPLIGINSRDLSTFEVDPLAPVRLHGMIDWRHRSVFESGVFTRADARFAAMSGFDGVLVGEAVVREPQAIREISAGLTEPRTGVTCMHPTGDFWVRLGGVLRNKRAPSPLVKICGITNRADAEHAVVSGADILGFVFAESPRRADPELAAQLADLDVLKVAVVVTGGTHGGLPEPVAQLLQAGLVDAVQFHGDESGSECESGAFPYYKAIRISDPQDAKQLDACGSPRTLVDVRSPNAYGGTGSTLSDDAILAARKHGPLWLAGGLGPDNIARVIRSHHPELVDASSRLEATPGKKDHAKLEAFIKEINRV